MLGKATAAGLLLLVVCALALCGLLWAAAGPDDATPSAVGAIAKAAPRIVIQDGQALLENSFFRLRFDIGHKLFLREMFTKLTSGNYLKHPDASRLFVIATEEAELDADDFTVQEARTVGRGARKAVQISLLGEGSAAHIAAELTIAIDDSSESTWSLSITNGRPTPIRIWTYFPLLDGLQVGNRLEDNSYLFPALGGIITDKPMHHRARLGFVLLQCMDVYSSRADGGLYLRSNEHEGVQKGFELRKKLPSQEPERLFYALGPDPGRPSHHEHVFTSGEGMGLGIYFVYRDLPPGGNFEVPSFALGVHRGDWHQALDGYRKWVASWYKKPNTPQWLKKVIVQHNFQPGHFRYGTAWTNPGEEKKWRFDQINDLDDLIELWGYWSWPAEGQAPWSGQGDYAYHDDWGGAEGLRDYISEVHERGARVSLYVEGMVVGLETRVGREHGMEWGILNPDGTPARQYGMWNMCPGSEGWQDYLAETCARLVRETGCDAIRLDSYGVNILECHNPAHHHESPGEWFQGLRVLCDKVRKAIRRENPDAALILEGPGCDVLAPYVDGALSYAAAEKTGVPDAVRMAPINLFRFCFPEMRLMELFVTDKPGAEGEQQLRYQYCSAIFNGYGLFDNGSIAQFLPWVRQDYEGIRSGLDVVTTGVPEPLIPSLAPGLCVNEFSADGKTIYTLYNNRADTVSGDLFSVPYREGYRFADLFNRTSIATRRDGDRVVVRGTVLGRDVTCIAALARGSSEGRGDAQTGRFGQGAVGRGLK